MEKLSIDIESLKSLHRFGDELEAAIKGIESSIAEFKVIRDAKDCIGRHWYGMRCQVTCKKTGTGFYLHTGLIYFPSTRTGLMVELDEQNNQSTYKAVLKDIKENEEFEINRDEKEYFKLFMPDDIFQKMTQASAAEQVLLLREFVQAAGEAIAEAGVIKGFSITYDQMKDSLNLVNAFDKVLNQVEGEVSKVSVNYQDPDNFGQYAEGFRYYLKNKKETLSLYSYFGAIYSYKKEPAGVFAEVDRFSNQKEFDRVFDNIEESPRYHLSKKEPGFIKLFMKEETIKRFHELEYEGQIELLTEFLKACNDAMIKAGEKENKNER